MRGIEVHIDGDTLRFYEDEVLIFELHVEALRDNEQLKNEVLEFIKFTFDSFFDELRAFLEKSKEEEGSE